MRSFRHALKQSVQYTPTPRGATSGRMVIWPILHAKVGMTRLQGYRSLLMVAFVVALTPLPASAGVVNSILLQWRAQAEKCEDSDRVDDITMVQVAMFEAVNSISRKYTPYKALIPAARGSSEIAAAAAAAHGVMIIVCPDMKSTYDGALKKSLALVKDSVSRENGAKGGRGNPGGQGER